ncbi:unnamed protein product [Ectocarpus sp. CCAP 1310/34]|nr:unnamed protein product [Ectocarpus sp. CCAP 1310/34]
MDRFVVSPASSPSAADPGSGADDAGDGPKSLIFFALVKPNRVQKRLRRGASSGALRGRLPRGPLTSRGGPMVAAAPRPRGFAAPPVY